MKKHIRQLYVHTLGGNTISTRNDNIKETYKLYILRAVYLVGFGILLVWPYI